MIIEVDLPDAKARLHIFKRLAEKIRREQSKFEVDIAQLLQGQQPKPKKSCYRKLDERIARVVLEYDPLQIPQYLKNIAANVSL